MLELFCHLYSHGCQLRVSPVGVVEEHVDASAVPNGIDVGHVRLLVLHRNLAVGVDLGHARLAMMVGIFFCVCSYLAHHLATAPINGLGHQNTTNLRSNVAIPPEVTKKLSCQDANS